MFIAYFVEQIWKFTELKDNESVMNNCARHSLCTFVHDVHGINHNNAADSRVWPTLLCTVQVDVISLSVGSFNFRKDSTLFIHIRGNLIKMANILNAHLDHHVYHIWITSEILFIYIYLLIVPIWKWISWLLGEHFFNHFQVHKYRDVKWIKPQNPLSTNFHWLRDNETFRCGQKVGK